MNKVYLLLLLFLYQRVYSQNTPEVRIDEVYSFMNSAEFNGGKKLKIDARVCTHYYDSAYRGISDSTALRGIDAICEWFKIGIDTLHYFIDSADIAFFKYQIKHPVITQWDKNQLKKNIKPKKGPFYHDNYCIPLFSIDKKTVIIRRALPRGLLAFHWNDKTKHWDLIDYVQTGT